MALMSPAQYRESLRDGRAVYFRGERVEDVTAHPVIGLAVEHASLDYAMAEDPRWRELAVGGDPETGEPVSRYYLLPRSAEDLLQRSALIERATALGGTLVVLIKEIGSDAIFALRLIARAMDERLGTRYLPRVEAFYRRCRQGDLAAAVAQTDVKGDRSLGPSQQAHPDYYLRAVGEDAEGITVRGAKAHTSVATNAHELIVLPTRALRPGDEPYALAFAVPLNAPGLTLVASPWGAHRHDPFERPISSRHRMMETLTIFEDVKVPWERVFLKGEVGFAGPLAHSFVEFHRFTAMSYKLPLLDLLVGAAHLAADYNGVASAAHVRDKLARLVAYACICRATTHMAAHQCRTADGVAVPNAELLNVAKFYFATNFHQALAWVQDIAGGLLVTAPGREDAEHPRLGELIDKYLGGRAGVSAEDRLRLFRLIAEITASDYAGYQGVLAIHAEGSVEAEKLTLLRAHDPSPAIAYAKELAGIRD
ncbi:MAG: 4-hydroxyphenylacetate 3-hydroxylase N-terminal domain-containing protein [Nitrospinota bacterium]